MTDEEFRSVVAHLDALVQAFETMPFPEVREMALDLLQAVDALHREALTRLVALLRERGQEPLLDDAAREPVIRLLFQLYDLIPGDALTRDEPATFIPLHQIGEIPLTGKGAGASIPRFRTVARLEEVPPGTMKLVELDGAQLLLFNIGGELYASGAQCPGSMAPLQLGSFSPPVLTCPWHNEAYDVRSGERVDGMPAPKLKTVPVTVIDGEIRVAPPSSP